MDVEASVLQAFGVDVWVAIISMVTWCLEGEGRVEEDLWRRTSISGVACSRGEGKCNWRPFRW